MQKTYLTEGARIFYSGYLELDGNGMLSPVKWLDDLGGKGEAEILCGGLTCPIHFEKESGRFWFDLEEGY